MRFNFSGKQDVYIEIAERYREYIRLGIIKNGEKLPSVREAAEELGVNPNTIARAYHLLEEEGYIMALPKKGAFVIFGQEAAAGREKGELADGKSVIRALREKGIDKETVLRWIEEVYEE